jgi:hypothetical protein
MLTHRANPFCFMRMTGRALCKGDLPRVQEPLQLDNVLGGQIIGVVRRQDNFVCARRGRKVASGPTYGDERADKASIHEEVAGLREPRRLALKTAAVLVDCALLVRAGRAQGSTYRSTDPVL